MPLTCQYYPAMQERKKLFGLQVHDADVSLSLSGYTVCPNCSNVLTISRADPTPKFPLGVNRFECRTCPYQYVLKGGWSEKTPMKQKEVEDVFGGKEEFANADSMGSKWRLLAFACLLACGLEAHDSCALYSSMSFRGLQRRPCILFPAADSKCRRAYDYIFEGMYSRLISSLVDLKVADTESTTVYHMWSPMARKLKRFLILFYFYFFSKYVYNLWSIDIYGVY